MSVSRLYFNSNDRVRRSDRPCNFEIRLPQPVDITNISTISLSHISMEFCPEEPTFPLNSGYFKMNVDGTDYDFLLDRSKLIDGMTALMAELNSYYQIATSTSDTPFSYDNDTNKVSITLSTTFSIYPNETNSGWERIGYARDVGATTATLVGSDYILTFDCSPNISRTSIMYVLMDMVDDSAGSNNVLNQGVLASIPIAGSRWGTILSYNPQQDMSVSTTEGTIDTVRIRILDCDYNDIRLQYNALVALELQLTPMFQDSNGNGVEDYREVRNGPTPLIGLGNTFY